MGLFPRGQIARTPSHRRREAIATLLRGSSTIVFLAFLLLIPGPSVSAGVPPIARGHASPMGGSDWTNMNPGTAPSASVNMAMVYDSSADRIIVFGGYDGSPQGSDRTWAYDFESNTWTDLAPAVHPPAGWLDRAAYDRWAERMILFGGYDGVAGALSNQTWAFNFQANAWTNLQPARHPSARSRQGMAFDAQSDRTILFGGLTAEGDYSSETWAYSIDWDSWANMTSEVRPPGRRSPGMVYDAAADRTILFGGYDSSSGIVYNDTWAYDFESNSWTNRNPPAAPSPRFGMGLAYDARLDRSILFGGAEGGDNVTWAYDFTNNSRTSQRRRGTGPFPSGGIRPRTTARPPSPTASTAAQMSTTCRPSPTSATCVRMWMETSRTESPTCTASPRRTRMGKARCRPR